MKKLIVNYNLEILTAVLAIILGVSLFFWNSLTIAGKALLGFMVLYTLHEWEESKFRGGFYDLFFGGFGIKKLTDKSWKLPKTLFSVNFLIY